MFTRIHIYIGIVAMLFSSVSNGQGLLQVDNSGPYNDPGYLLDLIKDPYMFIGNVTFNGASGIPAGVNADMIGYFDGTSSNLGLSSGIILNTGNVHQAPGPNDSNSDGTDNFTAGDPDLDQLLFGASVGTFNAAILEFDFYSLKSSIVFEYVFASEEYNEYVCSDFNDVFGIFISGPGISGPFSNNAKNIAQVPSSSTYVGINSVNNGTIGWSGFPNGCGGPGDPGLLNSIYFVDNEALGGQSIQYDGFTTVLTAQATLIPYETYHVKLAIGDANDGIYDSALFLKGIEDGCSTYNTIAVTACDSYTWINGITYDASTDCSIFNNCPTFVVSNNAAGCDSVLILDLTIIDSMDIGPDIFLCEGDTVQLNATQNGSSFQWFPSTNLSNDTISNPFAFPDTSITYFVQSTAICNNTDSLTVFVVPDFTLNTNGDTTVCAGNDVQLGVQVNPPGLYSYHWSPASSLNFDTISSPVSSPVATTNYIVTVLSSEGCLKTDSQFITVLDNEMGIHTHWACDSYTWIDGNTYYTSTNSPTFTFTGAGANGCDSVVALDLTIDTVDIGIIPAGPVLTANVATGTYQWLDCNNNHAPIPGETNQSFTATANGSYAVEVTVNCVDTSDCHNVTLVGVEETHRNQLTIFPNPTTGVLSVVGASGLVSVYDVYGRLVFSTESNQLDLSASADGIYFLHVFDAHGNLYVDRVVKE